MTRPRVVLLEDYLDYARQLECTRKLKEQADLEVFTEKAVSVTETIERTKNADIVITIRDRVVFTRELLSRLRHVKLISVAGARLSHIDLKAAAEYGIRISAPSLDAQGIGVKAYTAEQTWNLILGLVKDTVMNAEAMRQGKWQTRPSRGLFGKTLGVLGLGMVGAQVAEIGKAMKMRVIAWSPHLTRERAEKWGAEYVQFEHVFTDADIVSIHAPLTPENRDMIGDAELKLMRPHALLINTARAALVKEVSLRKALDNGTIAGAGLDVYWEEPLPADHWLRTHRNVFIQPHLGGFTDEGYASLLIPAIENAIAFLDGKPKNLVSS